MILIPGNKNGLYIVGNIDKYIYGLYNGKKEKLRMLYINNQKNIYIRTIYNDK